MPCLDYQFPLRFVYGPCTSSGEVIFSFLLYRILLAAITVTSLMWSMITEWNGGKWFIFFGHWGFLVLTFQCVIATMIVIDIYARENCCEYSTIINFPMPFSYKIYWVLYNMAIPNSFLITVYYWLIAFNYEKTKSVFVHAINTTVVILELFIGGPPSRFSHVIQPLIFMAAYIVFTVIYWKQGGTDLYGNSWVCYEMDWSNTSRSLKAIGLIGVMITLLHILVTLTSRTRDMIINILDTSDHDIS